MRKAGSAMYFIHALTPLHPGVGQGVGSVDLPVAREQATGIPYLPGSSIKGVLRDEATRAWPANKVTAIFGPDTENAHKHAGSLYIGDAKLLLLPVRSYSGVFAYATSPYLLDRLEREAKIVGLTSPQAPPPLEGEDRAYTGKKSQVVYTKDGKRMVYLEDLDFHAETDELVDEWERWIQQNARKLRLPIKNRLLILNDSAMSFLLQTALEVVTRIRINDETKTVEEGALWYEENIPAESVLYGVVSTPPESFEKVEESRVPGDAIIQYLKELIAEFDTEEPKPLQFGGNATIGRGFSRMVLANAGS